MLAWIPTAKKVAWAAGLFEGEGCAGAYQYSGRTDIAARMSLRMNDEDVVRRFGEVVGVGKVYGPYRRENGKPYWNWQATGWAALKHVFKIFAPYLGERRTKQFKDALAKEPEPWHWVPEHSRTVYGKVQVITGHWRRSRV